jgi:hypothetical protein
MKKIKTRKLTENKELNCVLCQANFELWIDSLKLNQKKEEDLKEKFLKYCPCPLKDNLN